MTTIKAPVDVEKLRSEVKVKYAEVAQEPDRTFHFHHGRPLAEMLGYPADVLASMPDRVIESFAGVGNPFSLGPLHPGETVVDVGSGSGFDSLIASRMVGPEGRVAGVDMTDEMLEKARGNAALVGAENVEFRQGYAEVLPVEDGFADVVISNGVINLCPDKRMAFEEIFRVLKPGGRLMLADIVVHKDVPLEARQNIDLWTA